MTLVPRPVIGLDCLRPKPIVQLREIKVPALPISADRVSRECAFAGLTEYSFGMHHEEAGSVFWTDGRLPDWMRRLGRSDRTRLG